MAGIRTPQHLTIAGKEANKSALPAMEEVMPEVLTELWQVRRTLEDHYRDMQDIEFTVQRGKLWMLQTRSGKRTAQAALKIAVSLVEEDVIGREEAIGRIEPASLDQLLHPTLDPKAKTTVLARGLPASPGAASGKVVFSAEEAESLASRGEAVILVRIETSPEDIHGMHAARGILTTRGGMTSHAAVVARGMGRPCVAGAGDLRVDYAARTIAARNTVVKAGEIITIDGSTGEVMLGEVPTIQPELSGDFATLMGWADAIRGMKVRANAETAADARMARRFGAEGIGLSRTEHMFFQADRIGAMRRVIMAEDETGRRAGLAELLPMQREDFAEIFRIMKGFPVTIRLLDPPLHEFLPKTEAEFGEMARLTGKDVAAIRHRAVALHEVNPMLGHRGCRLGITYPEIYEMQAAAIFEAAVAVTKETGEAVEPEIMVPLIATKKEFDILKAMIDRVGSEVMDRSRPRRPLSRRHDDRAATGGAARRRDRRDRRILQLWHQRSDPDRLWPVARRRRELCRRLSAARDLRARPVRDARCRRGRRARAHRRRARTCGPPGFEARHLRRAWRRSRFDSLLPGGRSRLRVLLALPRADCPTRRGAGRAGGRLRRSNRMTPNSGNQLRGLRASCLLRWDRCR